MTTHIHGAASSEGASEAPKTPQAPASLGFRAAAAADRCASLARLLSPAHARAVAHAGGLIGAWPSGVTSTTLADFADEIARLADLVGPGHVAVGTDMDANYRPVLTSYADFAALPGLLASRGLSDAETDQILGTNALALLRTVAGQAG